MYTALRYVRAPGAWGAIALAICIAFVTNSVAHTSKAGQPREGKASADDKYSLQVPNGLAFSDFRGYEDWEVVAVSQTDDLLKVEVANPVMIAAYRAGVPGNGKAFPRRLQDSEDRVETEKEHGGSLFSQGTGKLARHFSDREGCETIPEHERMGVCRV
jgi:hypothetical protein